MILFFPFILSQKKMFTAKARAPLEPYYGRYIGPFTEFAHKIKVSSKKKPFHMDTPVAIVTE